MDSYENNSVNGDDHNSSDENATSSEEDTESTEEDDSSVDEEAINDARSSKEDEDLSGVEAASLEEEIASSEDETGSPIEENDSSGEEAASLEDNASSEDETESPVDDDSSLGEEAASLEEENYSSEEETGGSSVEENDSSGEEKASLEEENASSEVEAESSVEDNASSEDESRSLEEDDSLGEEAASLKEDESQDEAGSSIEDDASSEANYDASLDEEVESVEEEYDSSKDHTESSDEESISSEESAALSNENGSFDYLSDGYDSSDNKNWSKEDAVLNLIETRIKLNGKCATIIAQLEQKEKRKLGNMEIAFIENNYIDIALKTWVDTSLKSVQKSLNGDQVDLKDFPAVLKQLSSSINVISDLGKCNEWLDKWSQPSLLETILAQPDLFSEDLSKGALETFKRRCTDMLMQKCLEGRDQNDRVSTFLQTLGDFLTQVNIDIKREKFLDEVNHRDYIMKDTINGKEFVVKLTKHSHKLTSLSLEIRTRFKDAVSNLTRADWDPGFSTLVKETCRQLLLQPDTTVKLITEKGGSQIIEARGTAITCSRIIEQLILLKKENPDVVELRIVCTTALHIDCNLDQAIWHGTNVVVVTDHLYVIPDGESSRSWNVSGMDGNNHLNTAAESGRTPGEDAQPGLPGLPGESGGNIHIFCHTAFNVGKWSIRSNGGKGSRGQDGGHGVTGRDGKDADRFKDKSEFLALFPTPSRLKGKECGSAERKIHHTLQNRVKSFSTDEQGSWGFFSTTATSFFKEGKTADGRTITASFHQFVLYFPTTVRRQTLIMYTGTSGEQGQRGGKGGKGGEGGEGGFNGSMIYEVAGQQPTEIHSAAAQRAANGDNGNDGNGGTHGKHGKAAGDVGYTDCITNSEPYFFGFNKEEKLKIVYGDSADEDYDIRTLLSSTHAGIRSAGPVQQMTQQGTQEEKTSNKKQKREEATKKNAITSIGALSEYVNTMMTQRSQTINTLTTKAGLMKDTSCSLNQFINQSLETKEKESIAKKTQAKINMVKTMNDELLNKFRANKAVDDIAKFPVQDDPIICTNCPHGSPLIENPNIVATASTDGEVKLALNLRSKILDRKPTKDDADNIFHCATGKPDSCGLYVCSNSTKYRTELASLIKRVESKDTELQLAIYSSIERFVRGLEDEDEKEYPEALHLKKIFEQFEKDELQNSAILLHRLKQEIQEKENKKLTKLLVKSPSATTLNDQLLQIPFLNKSSLYKALDKCSEKLKHLMEQFAARKEVCKFNWQKNLSSKVIQEYSNYIQSPLRTLSRPELELLALYERIRIQFYSADRIDDEENPTMEFIETINPNGDDEIHVLRKEDGSWQRLDVNTERHSFYEQRDQEATFLSSQMLVTRKTVESKHDKNASNSSFEELIKLTKDMLDDKTLKYIHKINPTLGISKELSTAILRHFQSKETLIGAADLCYLVERVIDWRVRNENPVFYVHVVANFCPLKWKYEFLLLEIEDRLQMVLPDKTVWRNHLYTLGNRMFQLLRKRLHESTQVTKERLAEVLALLAEKLEFFETDLERLSKLSLEDWLFELKTKFWEKEISNKLPVVTHHDEKREAVYCFLEIENKRGEPFCRKLLQEMSKDMKMKTWQDISARLQDPSGVNQRSKKNWSRIRRYVQSGCRITDLERSFSEIVAIMKEDSNTSDKIKGAITRLKMTVNLAKNFSKTPSIGDVVLWKKVTSSNKDLDVDEFLSVFDKVVEMKMGFRLRDTQRVAIVAFLTADKNILTQASTGEGKSLIVTAVAISQALKGKKVDIITSSALLAIRDSMLNSSEGGVRDIYEAFGLDVANNCSPDEAARTRAYNAHVVYGELANYQRDYLLHTFYNKNIKGSRNYDFVIVDEVDCMLLDRGNNMLYLSHDIPGMESLESLYVFIWEKIRLSKMDLEEIRSAIFYDIYGQINKDDLENINSGLKELSAKNAMWAFLIQSKVIDRNGRLLIECISEKQLNYSKRPELTPRLMYYFQRIVERYRRIRVPIYLLPFVERHLDTWLTNALRASVLLNPEEHYVVDQDRTNRSPDLNPLVTIIDPDTGADQTASQWDGALHQFLQLKEGCQITMQSLKAVFASNVSYIKRYKTLSGLTGTLGSEPERAFLKDMYEADFMTIPTAFPKKFTVKPAKVMNSDEKWMDAIVEEAKHTTLIEKRSILIFCRSINEVNIVQSYLKKTFTETSHFHTYTRDYEKFGFESNALGPGHIIVATNLAGRGTDIKISRDLHRNGGLHVCLTYLPENVRIEEQALGRAGRKGAPGSGILILNEANETEWNSGKVFDMKEERNRNELQRISQLKDDFNRNIRVQELCFQRFSERYAQLQSLCTTCNLDSDVRDIVCFSALDRWALWLDSIDDKTFKSYKEEKMLQRMDEELILKVNLPAKATSTNILDKVGNAVDNFFTEEEQEKVLCSFIDTVKTPGRLVTLAKHFSIQNRTAVQYVTLQKNRNHSLAKQLLDGLIKSDPFSYPSAHYYKSLISVKESNKITEEFTRELRSAEIILNEHIQQQMYFSAVVGKSAVSNKTLFYSIDAYKKQKENVIQLLEIYLDSIKRILGGFCSASGLVDAGINGEIRAEEVFDWLIKNKFISQCRVDISTSGVSSTTEAIQKLANDYALEKSSIEAFLKFAAIKNLSEKQMEKELKSTQMFQKRTRKEFWTELVTTGVITEVQDCIVISKSDCDTIKHLDQNKSLQFFQEKRKYPILYNPFYPEKLEKEGKLVFKKEIIKKACGEEYRFKKKNFESNKFAIIDLDKLKMIDLSSFGRIDPTLFKVAEGIVENECQSLWSALIEQKIIKNDGSAGDRFNEPFNYPSCPAYAHGINYLIRRTFMAERIRHRWIQSPNEQPGNDELFLFSPVINEFPLNPHRSLLADLLEVHIIFAPTVPAVKINESKLKKQFTDKTDYQRILDYLISNRPTYACLETPDVSLKPLEEAVTHRRDLSSIATELYVFGLSGFEHTITMNEKRWSAIMIAKCLTVIVIGLAQVILGAVVQLYSAGWMTHVATGLCSEGVSDILFGLQALISGNSFTWADYGRHKLASIAITVTSIGIGALLSKGVSLWKYGYKTAGPGFEYATKEVAKNVSKEWLKQTGTTITRQVVKSSAIQIGKGVGLGLVNHCVEAIVREKMTAACRAVGGKLNRSISEEVEKTRFNIFSGSASNLQDTLADLYRMYGPVEANRIVLEKKRLVLIGEGPKGWLEKCSGWITSSFATGFQSALTTGLSNAVEKRQKAGAVWAAAKTASKILFALNSILEELKFIAKLTFMTSTHLTSFKLALQECLRSDDHEKKLAQQSSCYNDAEKIKEFQDKVVNDMKAALEEKAGQLVQVWTTKVLKQTTTFMVTLAARQIKNLSQNAKESAELEELRRLRSEERKRQLERGDDQSREVDNSKKPSEEHIKACLELMKQTKSPKVFAEIIREGVPLDRFSADGLSVALTNVLKHVYGIDIKGGIQFNIESSDGKMRHTTNTSDGQQGEVIDIQLDRAVDGQSMGHYNNSSDGEGNSNNDYNCLFDAVADKMLEQYPQIGELSANDLREITAHAVETDPNISDAIRNGWHRHTIQLGFFGGQKGVYEPISGLYADLQKSHSYRKPTKKGKREVDDKENEKEELEADHSLAASHIKYAKDKKIQDLGKGELPCILLTKADHETTLNYLHRAKGTDKNLFSKNQIQLMRKGEYMEAIRQTIDVNYIENVGWLNETDQNRKNEHINTTRNYFSLCKDKGLINGAEETKLNNWLTATVMQHSENLVRPTPSSMETKGEKVERLETYYKDTYQSGNSSTTTQNRSRK